jgi:hypothetical protein
MQRPEVYDRHASVPFKDELEEAARSQKKSVDELLEQIVREWLERFREQSEENDEERQRQLRASAMKLAGAIEGDDPHRAENASAEVRTALARKYGR